MDARIGSRYLKGFDVAIMNSSEECGDDPKDCLIKRLYVKAVKNDINNWELVACIEIEVVSINKDGVDEGFIALAHGAEVYRVPFPFGLKFRKEIIRSFVQYPKYFVT
ncbi:MAG: hypothetical protein M0P64_00140 [Candidatus Pacebacteria bacterium]|jgi:hypothetical protein|nr:hypothetical protein [Candidatus Paceibacterota bacterium]